MNFTLTVLGSASAKPVAGRFQSAQVLSVRGRSFLIDCGEGVQMRLEEMGLSPLKLCGIFISHIHGDHLFGLYGLLSTMGMLGRSKDLEIFAPASFAPILKFFLSYYGTGIPFTIRHVPLEMKSPEVIFEDRHLEISAFPLNHGIPTFGFLFREKMPPMNVRPWKIEEYGLTLTEIGTVKRGEDVVRTLPDGSEQVLAFNELGYKPYDPRSYAYCSDTAPFPELPSWVAGVDLLYHEATYTSAFADQALARHHSTAMDAARCAKEAGAKKLLIGHYSSRCTDAGAYQGEARTVFPETYAVSDLDEFDVPLVKHS